MLKYTEDHEWLRAEGDEIVVGITAHASEQLGDVVFIELPEVGREVTEGEEIVVIERYLPAKMGEAEILAAVQAAIAETGAASAADMGKLMGVLKPKLAGQADMGLVSRLVKQALAG